MPRGVAVSFGWLLAALSVVLHAQQRSTFRAGVSTVPIYATVRSSDGRLVPGLSREDFEIRDNGAIADVAHFSREIVPITVTMMLDMSGSQAAAVAWMRDAAGAFVDQLLPADRARIGTFGIEIAISPRLTGDQRYLRRVLQEELWPGGGTPLWDALDEAMSSLDQEEGRRVILAMTDGLDSGSTMTGPWSRPGPTGPLGANGKPVIGEGSSRRHDAVRRRAIRENFMVYAVGRYIPPGLLLGAMSTEMKSVAVDSGGGFRIFPPRQDARAAMAEVADELHHQYLLGFAPATIDNKLHTLDVRVKRAGMSVQSRRSYLADGR